MIHYTRSPLEDSRLFGPGPWKVLASIVQTNGFLSNPAPGENLESGNLVMETGCTAVSRTPNLPTNIVDFRGFDSSIMLCLRGGIIMSIGNFPESLSQAMLVGIMLAWRLGARPCPYLRVSYSRF